jgi:hypothetical protein
MRNFPCASMRGVSDGIGTCEARPAAVIFRHRSAQRSLRRRWLNTIAAHVDKRGADDRDFLPLRHRRLGHRRRGQHSNSDGETLISQYQFASPLCPDRMRRAAAAGAATRHWSLLMVDDKSKEPLHHRVSRVPYKRVKPRSCTNPKTKTPGCLTVRRLRFVCFNLRLSRDSANGLMAGSRGYCS